MTDRHIYFVHDGQEFDFEIPEFCSIHPLPPEVVTAALDTLTVAVMGLATALFTDDVDTVDKRLTLLASIVMGMREDLGFGGFGGTVADENADR
jgi:hypothetical protein